MDIQSSIFKMFVKRQSHSGKLGAFSGMLVVVNAIKKIIKHQIISNYTGIKLAELIAACIKKLWVSCKKYLKKR